MTAPSRSPSVLSPALRGVSGFVLLLLAACSVGIDDRPVPPEAIPSVAYQQPESDYGAPAASAEPVLEAAPAYAGNTRGGENMVWRTGAQPVVERATLDAPEAFPAQDASVEEPVSVGESAASSEQDEPGMSAEASEPETAAVAPADTRTFRLAPFVGLDADASAPLRRALQAEAEQNGFNLGGGTDALVLKGYLSSMEDDGAAVLIYVWDVYDAAGTRLTRIDGQQKLSAGSSTDPLALDQAAAEKLAARTVAALARWQPGGTG